MLLLLVTMLTCTQSICWSMPEHIAYNSSCLSFKFGLRWHLDYSRQNGKFSIHLEVPLVKAPDLIFACCLSHNYFIIICYSRTIKCALLRDYMVLRNTTGLQSKCHWWSILFWLGVWYQNYSKGAEQSATQNWIYIKETFKMQLPASIGWFICRFKHYFL